MSLCLVAVIMTTDLQINIMKQPLNVTSKVVQNAPDWWKTGIIFQIPIPPPKWEGLSLPHPPRGHILPNHILLTIFKILPPPTPPPR